MQTSNLVFISKTLVMQSTEILSLRQQFRIQINRIVLQEMFLAYVWPFFRSNSSWTWVRLNASTLYFTVLRQPLFLLLLHEITAVNVRVMRWCFLYLKHWNEYSLPFPSGSRTQDHRWVNIRLLTIFRQVPSLIMFNLSLGHWLSCFRRWILWEMFPVVSILKMRALEKAD